MRTRTVLPRTVLAALLVVGFMPAPSQAIVTGPVIYTTPTLYATPGQSIGVVAAATCDQAAISQCTAKIFFRTTVVGSPVEAYSTTDPGSGWSSLDMRRDPGYNAYGFTVHTFSVQLPSWVADPRGVDYIIKVSDQNASSYSPGVPSGSAVATSSARSGAYHVFVTTPSTIQHTPVLQAAFQTPITITTQVTCAAPCWATLFFRRTGLLQPSVLDTNDPPANPADGADVQWAQVSMNYTGQLQNGTTEQYGATIATFSGNIPAAYVDTRGVDYAIRVTDGKTRTYSPGTVYNGYVVPTDGARIGWWHVHVLHPVIANHVQQIYSASPGQPIALSVDSLCWTNSCAASIQYHWYGGPLLTASMTPGAIRYLGGAKLITFVATIPGGNVAPPTLSYRFAVSDGYTNAYSPGTFYNGYYLKLDGASAGEYTIAVP